MAESLLEIFKSLDLGMKHALADIENPRLLALAALEIAENKGGVDSLSSEHIVACLEAAGVATKKLSITRSLSGSKGLISTHKKGGENFYRIMTKGKKEIESFLSGNKLSVVRIEKDQPRTARLELQEILKILEGTVRICDPFYGMRTLDALDLIPVVCPVRFLTEKTSESLRKLESAIKDFKKERHNTEFRLAEKSSGLHDRYVVTESSLLLLGHGLKDIGGKESFLIKLDGTLIPDLITEIINSFDEKWAKSILL